MTTDWTAVLIPAGQVGLAVVGGLLVHWVVFATLPRLGREGSGDTLGLFADRLRRPSLLVFPLMGIQLVLPSVEALPDPVGHLLTLAVYGALIWVVVAFLGGLEAVVRSRHDVTVADNLEARRVHTQISVMTRALMVVTVIVGTAAALMTFEPIRALGTAILASAGLAGLVIGLAARPVLENLIAGLQIALTQPIRLDDVVVIDGEWGRIEEITVTYVVVRIWDQRRLIVPFSRIIAQPFQNWTRHSSEILGTVFIHTDYTVPVEALRTELEAAVKEREEWDERVCVLQVTDAGPSTMELRALVSARDSGQAWDLRVHLRERLLEFLQREYPESLPRTRVELPIGEGVSPAGGGSDDGPPAATGVDSLDPGPS
jgi:small-conductance mechanosensitive channel